MKINGGATSRPRPMARIWPWKRGPSRVSTAGYLNYGERLLLLSDHSSPLAFVPITTCKY